VSVLLVVLALVAVQRLGELLVSARNTGRLLAEGGIEHGRRHYPLFVLLHGGWLLAMLVTVPWDREPVWPLLILFLALQPARVWIIASLCGRWTTRVIVVPGRPRVRRGPYRWLDHPNYLLVSVEIALLPLAFGAVAIAVVASLLNALLLGHRLRVENAALAAAESGAARQDPGTAD
jgi:methyltransferase